MRQTTHGSNKHSPTDSECTVSQQIPGAELSAFQYQLLVAIAERGGTDYGLGLADLVGQALQEEINHGRLYPNLDELAERGLIAKGEIDNRTNKYELTEAGARVLEARLDRLSMAVDALHATEEEDA